MRKNRKPASKSPDYPLYEKMQQRSPRAAIYWLIGDRLYHAGLFMTIICLPALFYFYTQGGTEGVFIWAVAALAVSVAIFFLGIYYKRESYKLAIKAGIDINSIS